MPLRPIEIEFENNHCYIKIHNTSDSTVEFLHRHDRITPATLSPSPLAYKKPIHPTEMPCITTCTELPIDDTNKSTSDDKYPWLDPDDIGRNMTDKEILQMKLNLKDSVLDERGKEELLENVRNKRAIPALAIIQGIAAIGGMMIKGINALVDAKRASSFNIAIKLVNENVQITHDPLITLENRTAMMAKAIRLIRQYRMMTRAHERYNRLFRQTHKTFQIHHLALLMFKDYIMILVGILQRIHRQYVRYESALDDTLIGIEHLNSGYLTHRILDPKILAKYFEAVEDDLEETAPEFEPVFTNVYQYYGNSLISFTNTIDDLLLQLLILIKLKVQVPMSLFSIETAPVPLDAETYLGEKREYTQIILETELIALT